MIITWYGENCFKLQAGETSILIDPISSSTGLQAPRGKQDVVIKTLSAWPIQTADFNEWKDAGAFVIAGPGNYEVKEVKADGWALANESTDKFIKAAYVITMDSIRIGVLGYLSEDLDPKIAEHFKKVDVLFIPGGGKPFIEVKPAAKLIRDLAPKVIIPSLFKVQGLKRKAESIDTFLKELGQKDVKPEEKFSFREKEIADFKSKVVVLKV